MKVFCRHLPFVRGTLNRASETVLDVSSEEFNFQLEIAM